MLGAGLVYQGDATSVRDVATRGGRMFPRSLRDIGTRGRFIPHLQIEMWGTRLSLLLHDRRLCRSVLFFVLGFEFGGLVSG